MNTYTVKRKQAGNKNPETVATFHATGFRRTNVGAGITLFEFQDSRKNNAVVAVYPVQPDEYVVID